jgi:uncharacterized protein YneF (UPF0154 family)
MLDRILSATPKQCAIVCFVVGICIGTYFAADSFQNFSHDDFSNGLTFTTAAMIFAGTASFGVVPGCVFLVIHYMTRSKPDESQWVGPWASEMVKDICRHLTEEEQLQYRRHAAACGALVGIVAAALIISFDLLVRELSTLAVLRVIVFLLIYFAGVYWMTRRYKQFLASTEYARRNGLEANQIDLRFWWHR